VIRQSPPYARRRALIVTLDPRHLGGVQTMRRALESAHDRIGLESTIVYARSGRRGRVDPRVVRGSFEGRPTLAVGYWPTIEYCNYWISALALRREVRRFPIVHVVGSFHSLSLIPIWAGARFVSWVATPFVDEIRSRRAGAEVTLSVRLNHSLRGVNQALELWTFRRSQAIWTISDYTTRRLAGLGASGAVPVRTQRPPVDTALYRPDGPRWTEGSGPYALWVGRLDDERKNVAALLRAFARAAVAVPALRLVLAGPGRLPHHAEATLRELGVGSRVRVAGRLDDSDLAAAYRGATAFVLASRQEGLGVVILEAQASGRPCVIMRCGGGEELISHGVDGLLVDQGDEGGLAAALVSLVARPQLATEFGARARARVEEEASLEAFRRHLTDLYIRAFPDVGRDTETGRNDGA
jgi:glycosyltransferase involved in cell wall biosynthesis